MMKINFNKPVIITLIFLITLSVQSQNLSSNQEKGSFLAKCYAAGVYAETNDSESSDASKQKFKKWILNIDAASENYINNSEFRKISDNEVRYIGTKGDKKYLFSQLQKCIEILGRP